MLLAGYRRSQCHSTLLPPPVPCNHSVSKIPLPFSDQLRQASFSVAALVVMRPGSLRHSLDRHPQVFNIASRPHVLT